MTKGLFDNDTACAGSDPMIVQLAADRAKKRWRDREVKGPHDIITHQVFQVCPARIARSINANVLHHTEELLQQRGFFGQCGGKLQQAITDHAAKGFGIKLRAGRANNPRGVGHLTHGKTMEKTGQDLAPGKVTRGAKDNEVERIDGDNA